MAFHSQRIELLRGLELEIDRHVDLIFLTLPCAFRNECLL